MVGKNLTWKNTKNKIFRGFWVFELVEMPEINRKLSKSKAPSVNTLPLLENSKKQWIYYLRTTLALITRKVNFKLQ